MLTRKQLVRMLAALLSYRDMHVTRYLLSRKAKLAYTDVWMRLATKAALKSILGVLKNNLAFVRMTSSVFEGGGCGAKIGSAINVRRPARFAR